MPTPNGTSPPPAAEPPVDENQQALEAIEAEAKRAGIRLPRRGETHDAYVLVAARHRGLLDQDAHVPDADVSAKVKTLLTRAGEDELEGGSPDGRALIAASAVHRRLNPEIRGVGDLRATGRRGVYLAVGHLVQALREDPTHAQRLSPAETALLTFYASDELRHAVDGLQAALEAVYDRVREAAEAEAARPIFADLLPAKPAPPQDDGFHFQDTRTVPGAEPVRDAAGQVVGHVKYGDVQPPDAGRSEPVTIPTPAHLRGPRSW